ncbi:unnamed protein product, partial [Cylindrotheca closterium]
QLHFEAAMVDSMVEGDVFEHCKERFTDLCIIFDAEKRGLQQSLDAMSNDPAMIMMARARRVVPKASFDQLIKFLERSFFSSFFENFQSFVKIILLNK